MSVRLVRSAGRTAILTSLTLALAWLAATSALAATTATYTATETIPVPPASSFQGSSGGDGWAVALTTNAVYNVYHHDSELDVACHLQADATPCWSTDYKTITDPALPNDEFATSGHPGLWLDQSTGKLYVFATEYGSDSSSGTGTGGVVCIDTTQPASDADPFCGFTPLTGPGEASYDGISAISDPQAIGTHWYAYNYVNGAAPASGTQNTLLCFDLTTFQACSGQPFDVSVGSGTVSDYDYPPPGVAAIGNQLIVPINLSSGGDELACFAPSAPGGTCSGSWPVPLSFSYDSSYGPAFPMLDASGNTTGFCLPAQTDSGTTDPCYTLSGASTATPSGMTSVITPTSGWNGPALVLGPRVYVPDGINNQVDCFDYSTSASCANFPVIPTQGLGILYTVNADPQRPTCIWLNSDSGQILDFDAYTAGACGEGPIRVLASSLVVPTQQCTPSGYGSLQVLSPAPGSYSSGSVSFDDFDGNQLAIPTENLDGTGSVSLNGLNLNANGLPQFLITLNGTQGTPSSVVVKLTWTGVYDPTCVKPGTTATLANNATPIGQPGVSTGTPTVQGPTRAAFAGLVNPDGLPTTAYFQYGLDSRYTHPGTSGPIYDHQTPAQSVGSDATSHPVTAQVTGLVPNALYHVRLVATNSAGTVYGPDLVFTSARLPNPGAPTLGHTVNLSVVNGIVLVKINGVFVPLTQLRQLPVGTVIDALHGTVHLITAVPGGGPQGAHDAAAKGKKHKPKKTKKTKTQNGNFGGAIFKVTQAHNGLATLSLVEGAFKGAPSYALCGKKKAGDASAAALSSKALQLLHASAKGKFATKGRYSSATVRGTKWTIADRCNGTQTHDITDSVSVKDFVHHKTIILHAGQTYLALAPGASSKKHKK